MRRMVLLAVALGLVACGGSVSEGEGAPAESQPSHTSQGLPGTCKYPPNWSCTSQSECDVKCNGGQNYGGGVCDLATYCCYCT